jgi:dUTP pyrophosphatase
MKIKFKKLHEDALIPNYAKQGDAGMDLHSISNYELHPNNSTLVKTGLAMELPIGYEAQVRPRSGLAYKNMITVLNSPGTIDAGYRNEIGVILINHSKEEALHHQDSNKIPIHQ